MGITVKNISEMFGKDVFTNRGVYGGKVSDVEINLSKFRIRSLIVEAAKGSFLSSIVGGKKGVIIPYQLVENVGDVVIIKHITAPTIPEAEEKIEEERPLPF
jgi:sporulation protein YlmC with PRC-barrel domain